MRPLLCTPVQVRALFFLATVCDDGRTFADVKSARMRLVDWGSGAEVCRYVPATKVHRCTPPLALGPCVLHTCAHPAYALRPSTPSTMTRLMPASRQGAHTALFVARVARGMGGTDWHLSTIGEVDHTARDFGSLGALTARPHARTHSQSYHRGVLLRACRVPIHPGPQRSIMQCATGLHPSPTTTPAPPRPPQCPRSKRTCRTSCRACGSTRRSGSPSCARAAWCALALALALALTLALTLVPTLTPALAPRPNANPGPI